MVTAIFPGSFDPITNGHLDIIKQASELFDNVIVAITDNVNKSSWLTVDERVLLAKSSVSDIPNVTVDSYKGLTVEYAKSKNISVIIRGLRNSIDFEYEKDLYFNNHSLNNNIKTIFIISKNEYNYISSSAIREIFINNGLIEQFVPNNVFNYLIKNK